MGLFLRTPQEQRGVQTLWKGPWNSSQPHQVCILSAFKMSSDNYRLCFLQVSIQQIGTSLVLTLMSWHRSQSLILRETSNKVSVFY